MIIGFTLYAALVFLAYYIFIGDPFAANVSKSWIVAIYLVPVIPALLRLHLFIVFPSSMAQDLNEEERDSASGRIITLTLAGFSFSALFALLVTVLTFEKSHANILIAIYFVLISVFSFVSSFSIEAYKHTRWQQHLSLLLDDVGKLSLLCAFISLMWVSTLERWLVYSACTIFLLAWLTDCIHRISLWNEFLTAQKRYLRND